MSSSEKRIDEIMAQMTLHEKVSMCRAFRLECFDTNNWTGPSRVHYVDKVDLEHKGMTKRFTAAFNSREEGEYQFFFTGDRNTELLFDGQRVWKVNSQNTGIPYEFSNTYKKGSRVDICIKATTVDTTPLEFYMWSGIMALIETSP